MKLFLSTVLFLSLLVSCRTTYVEIYYVKQYPMEWTDTVYFESDHWHYTDQNNNWQCVEIEADTFALTFKDTIEVPILTCKYKKREYNTTWDLKKFKKNESNNCCK